MAHRCSLLSSLTFSIVKTKTDIWLKQSRLNGVLFMKEPCREMEVHSWYLPAVTIISLRYCVISIEMWISRLPPLRCEYWGISQADNLHLQFLSVGSDHVLGWARAPLLADISLDTHSNIASRPNWYDSSQLNQKFCTILHLKKSTPFQFFQIVQPYSIFWSISTKDGIVQLANDFRRSDLTTPQPT